MSILDIVFMLLGGASCTVGYWELPFNKAEADAVQREAQAYGPAPYGELLARVRKQAQP